MNEVLVSIEIDGRTFEARKGAMLIEVADEAGIEIPRFCYHKKLSVAANCRMCLVEVEKAPKPLPACATPVMDGMKVFTRSELALQAQKSVMEFLLINHPLDCPICDQGGECELQDVAMGYGKGVSRFVERKRVVADKNIGPLIATEMTRCIHCTRCVRFGEEIGGMPELGATGRGEHMQIGTFIEQALRSEMSGNIIDLCPVGALTSKPFRFRARAWEMQQRDAIAPHDAVGSNTHVHVSGNRVMRVVPRENEALNEVWISDRDRFSYEGLYHEDRLLEPMVKKDGAWQVVDWETALARAVEGFASVRSRQGPGQIGGLFSPSATVEELYLGQKLLRGVGCANIDHRLRETDIRDQAEAPSFPWLGLTIAAVERLDAVLLVGAYPRKEHPILNHRLRKATLAGADVLVLGPATEGHNFRVAEQLDVGPLAMEDALAGIAAALAAPGGDAGAAEVQKRYRRSFAQRRPGRRAGGPVGEFAPGSEPSARPGGNHSRCLRRQLRELERRRQCRRRLAGGRAAPSWPRRQVGAGSGSGGRGDAGREPVRVPDPRHRAGARLCRRRTSAVGAWRGRVRRQPDRLSHRGHDGVCPCAVAHRAIRRGLGHLCESGRRLADHERRRYAARRGTPGVEGLACARQPVRARRIRLSGLGGSSERVPRPGCQRHAVGAGAIFFGTGRKSRRRRNDLSYWPGTHVRDRSVGAARSGPATHRGW